jgi:hypothetical protein
MVDSQIKEENQYSLVDYGRRWEDHDLDELYDRWLHCEDTPGIGPKRAIERAINHHKDQPKNSGPL